MNGLCSEDVYEVMTSLAETVVPTECIVELGTYAGHGTEALLRGAGDMVEVFTVDMHDMPGERYSTRADQSVERRLTFTDPAIRIEAERRIAGRASMITGDSAATGVLWDGPPVGLLVIDADHREGAVRRDFSAWEPHLAPGAWVCFDDYDRDHYPGVVAVVDALAAKGLISEPMLIDSLAVAVVQ